MARNVARNLCPHHESDFQFFVGPRSTDVGAVQRTRAAIAALTDARRAQARASLARARRFEACLARYERDLGAVVDERTRHRVTQLVRRQRATAYGLADFRPGAFTPEVWREAKQAAREHSHALMRRAGVPDSGLARVQTAAARRFHRVPRATPAAAAELEATPITQVPPKLLHGPGAGWFVKRPPYDAYYFSFDGYRNGGSYEIHHNIEIVENPFTHIPGSFGHYSRYYVGSASDWDAFFLDYRTGVGFWHSVAQPGKREVWVRIKSLRSRVDVWLDDEFGFSAAWSDYFTRIEIAVQQLPGIQGATDYWHVEVDGEPDSTWYHKPLVGDNADLWIPCTINFPPGNVLIWIGAHDNRACSVNDVSMDARFETQYVVTEVHIPN